MINIFFISLVLIIFGSSETITKLRNHSLNLYKELEKEIGLSTGLKQNGSVTVATNNERM